MSEILIGARRKQKAIKFKSEDGFSKAGGECGQIKFFRGRGLETH